MPNHVLNRVTFICDDNEKLKTVLTSIAGSNGLGTIDFNKLIPMPDNIYQGPLGQQERDKYGDQNWYDWSREHWGTKWNAYETKPFEDGQLHDTITFWTAWNPPTPVIRAIAEKFDIIVEHAYADECAGNKNCGIMWYKKPDAYCPDGILHAYKPSLLDDDDRFTNQLWNDGEEEGDK